MKVKSCIQRHLRLWIRCGHTPALSSSRGFRGVQRAEHGRHGDNFSAELLNGLGVETRTVNTRAPNRNGFDDGHVLVEIKIDGRWVLIDMDQHTTFWRRGKRLNLLDVADSVAKNDLRIGFRAASVPLAIGDFYDTGDNYDCAIWMETAIHSETTLRRWYQRIMSVPMISSCTVADSVAEQARVEKV